jgi:3',5'-nucleoside bisphosphate phosphatase
VFAHPAAASRGAVVDESAIRAFAAAGLDGIEVDHPDQDEPTRARLRELAAELGLLATGSSDYHGSVKSTPLGANTTEPDVFDELMARVAAEPAVGG